MSTGGLPLPLLLDSLTTAVAVHDNSKLLYANASLRAMFGETAIDDALNMPEPVREALRVVTAENAPSIILPEAGGMAVRELRILTRPIQWYGRDVLCSELIDLSNRGADSVIQMIQEVATAIRETKTLRSALKRIMHILSCRMEWTFAEIWQPDESDVLRRCCGLSDAKCGATEDPEGCGSAISLAPEALGRLFERHEIVWFNGSPAVPKPLASGVDGCSDPQSACGVPVVIEGRAAAVMMFYSREARTPDAAMRESIAAALSPLSAHLERLRVKSELEEVDQRLKMILTTADTATWDWDIENDLLRWDNGFGRLYGLSAGVTTGTPDDLLARVHPDDRAIVMEAVAASKDLCAGLHVEYRIVRHDGSIRWVLARGLTLCNEDGKPERVIGACWDETKSRSAADRLDLLAKFHEEYPQPVFRVLPDGTVSEPNAAAVALLDKWSTHGREQVPDDFIALLDEARQLDRLWVHDLEIGGSVYQFNIVPVINRKYLNVYAADVTMLRRSELAFQQASKMEAIGQLAGGIAHDFNNRLTIILGNLELLADELRGRPDPLKMLHEAKRAAEHGSNLAHQLQTIATPQPAMRNATNPNSVVRRLASLLDRCLGPTKELQIALNARDPQVLIDDVAFEDVLINLTINARDAMDDGGVLNVATAEVSLDKTATAERPNLPPGSYVVISISDTGRGMPEEVRARAFEPFFTTKQKKGTGLGLSMVYGFARQSGGYVELESKPGEGTCVRIYLPGQRSGSTAHDESPS